ncbi:hypothetical protein [Mycolicibacterium sp. CBMA 361]|uniref:hypothetical protein n=1 Tax=Mycolicibacterium sp. CBMA 361 TaxID=2606610 RepID=UPI0012DF63AE|nr:hypothetical protein [Mycolicibacterium sp. CBMA 361]MUM32507.1 hypothetical protein [Mycolicibacterium sp. CBMA 361]
MQTLTTRLSLPTAALMAASIVAVTPPPPAFTALPAPVVHSVQVPDIQFAATVADILQFPAFKQWVINQITDVVTIGVGLAKAGQGVQQTITAIPSLVVTVTQQILARDPVGALGTIEKGVIGAVTVIGGPILAAVIQRDQRALAVDQALVQAIPAALIGLGTGLVAGFNDFAVAAITAGQNVVAALLPLNIGNVITAVVDGIQLVAQGLSTGAGKVVDRGYQANRDGGRNGHRTAEHSCGSHAGKGHPAEEARADGSQRRHQQRDDRNRIDRRFQDAGHPQ